MNETKILYGSYLYLSSDRLKFGPEPFLGQNIKSSEFHVLHSFCEHYIFAPVTQEHISVSVLTTERGEYLAMQFMDAQ